LSIIISLRPSITGSVKTLSVIPVLPLDRSLIELIADEKFGGFTACVPGIPAYGEGATERDAIEDLQKAMVGYIETFGVQSATNVGTHEG
jgi:hypothetical protein